MSERTGGRTNACYEIVVTLVVPQQGSLLLFADRCSEPGVRLSDSKIKGFIAHPSGLTSNAEVGVRRGLTPASEFRR